MGRLMTRGLGWSWWWHFYDVTYWIVWLPDTETRFIETSRAFWGNGVFFCLHQLALSWETRWAIPKELGESFADQLDFS